MGKGRGDTPVLCDLKGLLPDHGLLVHRVFVAAEAEVSQAVEDIAALVAFHGLQHMGVMADDQVCAVIDGEMPQDLLLLADLPCVLHPPVKGRDHKLRPRRLHLGELD